MQRCSLSTSSAAAQLVKPPVQVYGVEGRYATALYSAASKQKTLEKVEQEVKAISQIYSQDKKFREFVLDPSMKHTVKKEAMAATLKKLGHSDITQNFFSTLVELYEHIKLTRVMTSALVAENGRLPKLESISRAFGTLMSAHRGEVICEVSTAKVRQLVFISLLCTYRARCSH